MPKLTPKEIEEFLAERGHLARIATLEADGAPHVVPVRFVHEAGKIWSPRASDRAREAFGRTLRRNANRPDAFTDEDVDHYFRAAGSPESRRAVLAGYKAFFGNRRRRARELGAVKLECPTLVLWGTREWALGDDGWKRIVADLPQARVEILDAGHFVMEERPEEVAALVGEFLSPSDLRAAAKDSPHAAF